MTISLFTTSEFWGKLLLKVMHYNIVLLPKKYLIVLVIFMEGNVLHYSSFTFS